MYGWQEMWKMRRGEMIKKAVSAQDDKAKGMLGRGEKRGVCQQVCVL